MTPLHFAAQQHHVEVAQALLGAGAVVDATDKHGNTPLWKAVFASQGRGELIALLREAGADPNLAKARDQPAATRRTHRQLQRRSALRRPRRLTARPDRPEPQRRPHDRHRPTFSLAINRHFSMALDMPKRLWLRYGSVAGIDAYVPRFKSAPDDSISCRAWHGWQRERRRELLPGAERFGAFDIEAQAFGSDRRVCWRPLERRHDPQRVALALLRSSTQPPAADVAELCSVRQLGPRPPVRWLARKADCPTTAPWGAEPIQCQQAPGTARTP